MEKPFNRENKTLKIKIGTGRRFLSVGIAHIDFHKGGINGIHSCNLQWLLEYFEEEQEFEHCITVRDALRKRHASMCCQLISQNGDEYTIKDSEGNIKTFKVTNFNK